MVPVPMDSAASVVVVVVDVTTHLVVKGAVGESVSVTSVLGMLDPIRLLSTSEGAMDAGRTRVVVVLDKSSKDDVVSKSMTMVVDGEMDTA